MPQQSSLADTYQQILQEEEPNFFRLYLSPHVAQTCFCLDRYMRTSWKARDEDYQSFLANSLEEALGGAIKLVRYNRPTKGPRPSGLIIDPSDRLAGFTSAELTDGPSVTFLPGLQVVGKALLERDPDVLTKKGVSVQPLVLVAGANERLDAHADAIRWIVKRCSSLVITCIDRESLTAIRRGAGGILGEIVPDLVVFDESFVDHAVPFSAFTARKSLFDCWNKPGKATFHSTTFQPNTISTRHFMNCLATADSEILDRHSDELEALLNDLSRRGDAFRRYHNPSLFRLIRATGFITNNVRAAGSFLVVDGRPVFDVVGGVACSIRGHNPESYACDNNTLAAPGRGPDIEDELGRRLHHLTGLAHYLPAVSGATAVENALKVALVAQWPRRHILALKAGFGGKTLFSLTGTANPSYKENIDPLYADVHYVDPFAPDATEQIDALMDEHDFAVVQLELIQSVGGVRRIPDALIRHLDQGRSRRGYLLLVDEVQTGMYRTGPFTMSRACNLSPDLLLLGKGTSDMMFPFALTLYSAKVHERLEGRGENLISAIKAHYGYRQGYETVVNVLRYGESIDLSKEVSEASALFEKLLTEGLATCRLVRDVRVFGLLIGIELDNQRWPNRWLRKRLSALYLLSMLRHERFPVFAGFCQYEPNVLKITPPLNASPDEIRQACSTIVDVLRQPLWKVLAAGLGSLIKSSSSGKKTSEHRNHPALERAAR